MFKFKKKKTKKLSHIKGKVEFLTSMKTQESPYTYIYKVKGEDNLWRFQTETGVEINKDLSFKSIEKIGEIEYVINHIIYYKIQKNLNDDFFQIAIGQPSRYNDMRIESILDTKFTYISFHKPYFIVKQAEESYYEIIIHERNQFIKVSKNWNAVKYIKTLKKHAVQCIQTKKWFLLNDNNFETNVEISLFSELKV
jgi:hypothetical protein